MSEHDRAVSSDEGMGEKRVSSKAEVRAYVCRPLSRGSPSKVPIHPRSDLCPDLEIVFQVINNGNDSVRDSLDAYVGLMLILATDVDPVK